MPRRLWWAGRAEIAFIDNVGSRRQVSNDVGKVRHELEAPVGMGSLHDVPVAGVRGLGRDQVNVREFPLVHGYSEQVADLLFWRPVSSSAIASLSRVSEVINDLFSNGLQPVQLRQGVGTA
jgi:hypothetical protein